MSDRQRPDGPAEQPSSRPTAQASGPGTPSAKPTSKRKLSLSVRKPSSVDNKPTPTQSANVDNTDPGKAYPNSSSNVDNKATSPSPLEQRGVAHPDKSNAEPTKRISLQFPNFDGDGNSPKGKRVGRDNPPGPSREVIRRILKAKKELADRNKDLDQNTGATPSRASPSKSARPTTVSKQTSAQYLNRGRMLLNRYRREQGIQQGADDFDAQEFVLWLFSLKPTLSASSWRVYRQAAYFTVMGLPDPNVDRALDLIDNDILENERKDPTVEAELERNPTEYKTSALKEKKFPKKDFDKYMAYLQYRSRSKMAPVLTDMLVATIFTGLRPIEWRATSLEFYQDPETGQRFVWLYVLNAKTTNERGNGIIRTLDLSDLDSRVLNAVKRTSDRGLEWHEQGIYKTTQSQLAQLLYKIGEDIFPRRKRHYALYSGRHQFIANMKSIMSPEEVSALSGHSVTKTAKQNYGRKAAAWTPEHLKGHAKPIASEVATVKKSADFYTDRIEKLKLAGVLHGNAGDEMG